MHALDYAKYCGYLAVQKRVGGTVALTTVPPRNLFTGETIVLATDHKTVEQILTTTNVAQLVCSNNIVLVF